VASRALEGWPASHARAFAAIERPQPAFSRGDLLTLESFVRASGMRPEGIGGGHHDLAGRPHLRRFYAERRDKPMRRLVIMKAAQMGLTIKLIYRAAWWTADSRRRINTALMFPTLDAVLDLHKSRFRPMMMSSSKMMQLVADVDAVGLVRVGASVMRFRGMRTGIGVDSFPADVMLFDEVRLMDLATIERAFVRVSESQLHDPVTNRRGVIELNSTAGFPGMDIHRYFERSTMNYWRTPCPNHRCPNHSRGIIMPLRWPDVVKITPDGPRYCCPDCGSLMDDEHITTQGWYQPEQDGAEWEGYQFSQILKGNAFLPDLWSAWQRGDNRSEFYNSRLGVPWSDPDAVPAPRHVVEACKREDFRLIRDPDEVRGDWVSVGIDQRAPEKHVLVYRHARSGGTYDFLHAEVVERSGQGAVEYIAALCRRWHAKIVIVDGEPSYDFARDLGTALGRMVWMADYSTGDRPEPISFVDGRDKATTRKVSGEVKWDLRVLMDRYKALDWALIQFSLKRMQVPTDVEALVQARTIGGVTQSWQVWSEYLKHLENIARATIPRYVRLPSGETAITNEATRIYRHLALDPHFAHAHLYALAGLARVQGGTQAWLGAEESRTVQPQIEVAAPIPPSALARERDQAMKTTCGSCRYMRGLTEGKGKCGHPNHAFMDLRVEDVTPKCSYYRRK
jgi:hypothetical protein